MLSTTELGALTERVVEQHMPKHRYVALVVRVDAVNPETSYLGASDARRIADAFDTKVRGLTITRAIEITKEKATSIW